MAKKKNKKQKVGKDLWRDDRFSFTAFGTKDEISLYLTQELWQSDKKDINTLRSMHVLEVEASGTTIRLPVESARELFHALGCVLEEP